MKGVGIGNSLPIPNRQTGSLLINYKETDIYLYIRSKYKKRLNYCLLVNRLISSTYPIPVIASTVIHTSLLRTRRDPLPSSIKLHENGPVLHDPDAVLDFQDPENLI
jgi:hypothetical protein